MKRFVLCFLLPLAASAQQDPLKAYAGTWVIFKDSTKKDTLCVTKVTWLPGKLKAGQVIHSRNSCFYRYAPRAGIYSYYEKDARGNISAASDITIDGRTWTYHHHTSGDELWRTLNIFNGSGDEIIYQTQRSDDQGKTWTTTRTGKEYRLKK